MFRFSVKQRKQKKFSFLFPFFLFPFFTILLERKTTSPPLHMCTKTQLQTLPLSSIDEFIDALTTQLGEFISFSSPSLPHQDTKFKAPRPPVVSLRQYVERIISYAPCTVECFVVAMVYLQRMEVEKKGFINSLTIHRLFLTSLLLASKYNDDLYFNNKFYARVGGIPLKELNALEIEFLNRSKFRLSISNDDFMRFSHIIQGSSCRKRGDGVGCDGVFSVSPRASRPYLEEKFNGS